MAAGRKGTKRSKPRKPSDSRKRGTAEKTKPNSSVIRWIPSRIYTGLGYSEAEASAVAAFTDLKPDDKVKEARRIIGESIINAADLPDARCALAITESESLLKGYATLDDPHRREISRL